MMAIRNQVAGTLFMILAALASSCQSELNKPSFREKKSTDNTPTHQSLTLDNPTNSSRSQFQESAFSSPVGCAENTPQALYKAPSLNQEIIQELDPQTCGNITGIHPETRWVLLNVEDIQGWISLESIHVTGNLHEVEVIESPWLEQQATPVTSNTPSSTEPLANPSSTPHAYPDRYQILTQKNYQFEYNCQHYKIQLPIAPELKAYYSNQDKAYYYYGELPEDWQSDYYTAFLSSRQDLDAIQYTIRSIQDTVQPENSDQLLTALVRFVQHLEYDCNKYFSYQNLLDTDYATSFPYETLADQSGVCGDFSLLLGKFLQQLDYGAVLLVYNRLNHMAVGLQCPSDTANYQWKGNGYCYIESTVPSRIGVIPDTVNQKSFNETPEFIPISEGKTFEMMNDLQESRQQEVEKYGSFILSLVECEEIAAFQILRNLEIDIQTLEGELSSLNQRITNLDQKLDQKIANYRALGCEGTLPEDKYDQCLTKFNNLKSSEKTYNQVVNVYNNTYQEYQETYSRYETEIADFNSDILADSVDCSTVTLDKLPTPQP